MNIGDYVRTKKGYIRKIISTDIDETAVFVDTHTWVRKENIIKVSSKIIELIQVGDYINGLPVYEDKDGVKFIQSWNGQVVSINDIIIETIVTIEQFCRMAYKIKE